MEVRRLPYQRVVYGGASADDGAIGATEQGDARLLRVEPAGGVGYLPRGPAAGTGFDAGCLYCGGVGDLGRARDASFVAGDSAGAGHDVQAAAGGWRLDNQRRQQSAA